MLEYVRNIRVYRHENQIQSMVDTWRLRIFSALKDVDDLLACAIFRGPVGNQTVLGTWALLFHCTKSLFLANY